MNVCMYVFGCHTVKGDGDLLTYYWPFFPAIMKISIPFLRAATVANNQLRERPKAPLTFLKKLLYAQKPLISAQSSADVPMQHQDQSNRCNGEVLFHQTASPKNLWCGFKFRWMQTKAVPVSLSSSRLPYRQECLCECHRRFTGCTSFSCILTVPWAAVILTCRKMSILFLH